MKLITLLSFAFVLFTAFNVHAAWFKPDKYHRMFEKNPVPESDQVLQHGKEIYLENCQVCHGKSGQGDGPIAKNLNTRPADLSRSNKGDGFLAAHITYGKGANMPAWGETLSESEIWNVVHYINSLRETAQD